MYCWSLLLAFFMGRSSNTLERPQRLGLKFRGLKHMGPFSELIGAVLSKPHVRNDDIGEDEHFDFEGRLSTLFGVDLFMCRCVVYMFLGLPFVIFVHSGHPLIFYFR